METVWSRSAPTANPTASSKSDGLLQRLLDLDPEPLHAVGHLPASSAAISIRATISRGPAPSRCCISAGVGSFRLPAQRRPHEDRLGRVLATLPRRAFPSERRSHAARIAPTTPSSDGCSGPRGCRSTMTDGCCPEIPAPTDEPSPYLELRGSRRDLVSVSRDERPAS